MFRADLHCHTTCSDGTLSPQALIDHAQQRELQGVAITDHDSVSAYAQISATPGLLIGVGAEFSAAGPGGKSLHILGYDLDLGSAALHRFCDTHHERREERVETLIQYLKTQGIQIERQDLPQGRAIGRLHLAQLLVAKGIASSIQDAFNRWLGDNKIPRFEYPSIDETISLIHQVGGKAFIAHPKYVGRPKGVRKLLEKYQFDGIEVDYPGLWPEETAAWRLLATQLSLRASGGSDFHGPEGGHALGACWVNEQVFRSIFSRPVSC